MNLVYVDGYLHCLGGTGGGPLGLRSGGPLGQEWWC